MMANSRSPCFRVEFLNLLTFGAGKSLVVRVINHVHCRVLRHILILPNHVHCRLLGVSLSYPPSPDANCVPFLTDEMLLYRK